MGLRRAEGLAEQHQLAGLRQPHDAGQDRSDAAGREHAPLDLGEEAPRALGEDGEVAVDRPLQPAAHGPAVDRADHHLVAQHEAAGHVLDRLDEGPRLRLAGGLVLDVLEVVAGAEGPPRPAQNQRAHRIVGERLVERRAEIGEQRGVQRIEAFRPVESERRDAVRGSSENGPCHRQSSRIRRFVLPPVRGIEAAGSSVTAAEARSFDLIVSSTRRARASEASAPSASSTSTGSRS